MTALAEGGHGGGLLPVLLALQRAKRQSRGAMSAVGIVSFVQMLGSDAMGQQHGLMCTPAIIFLGRQEGHAGMPMRRRKPSPPPPPPLFPGEI